MRRSGNGSLGMLNLTTGEIGSRFGSGVIRNAPPVVHLGSQTTGSGWIASVGLPPESLGRCRQIG